MSMNLIDPKAHDMQIAERYHALDKARQEVAYSDSNLLSHADAKYYYRGRKRVTDMTVAEALEITKAEVAKLQAHRASHSGEDCWVGYIGKVAPYEQERAENTLAERPARIAAVELIREEIATLEDRYTGWSRFFLVTSSPGHIHSSMRCHTCRPTTSYGWLPELSGKTEAEAVEAHGPALCSECYASAPTEWVGGKISRAQAEKRAA